MRLIDADALLKTLDGVWDCNDMVFEPNDHICNVPNDCKGCKWRETLDFAKRQVKASRTVEAISVVRCKDCKLFGNCIPGDSMLIAGITNGYCAAGKRKDGEQNA